VSDSEDIAAPSDAPAAAASNWSRRRLQRGVLLFVVSTAVGFWIVQWRGRLGGGLQALGSVAPGFVLAGGLLTASDQVLGGLRMWCAARAIGGRVGLGTCMRANLANVFLGGITPAQSGGGPAQILFLMRGGLSFAHATVASTCTFMGTVAVFFILALRLTLGGDAALLPGRYRWFTGGTVVVFATALLLCLVGLQPRLLRFWTDRLGRTRLPGFGSPRGRERRQRFLAFADSYAVLMHHGLRRGKGMLLATLALSQLIFWNKFVIAWVVVRGLGFAAPLGPIIRRQELQALVTYFAPTPGASGVAEISAAQFMGGVVPTDSMGAFLVLWRTFTLYLGMGAGAIVLLRSSLVTTPAARLPGAKSVVVG